MLDPNTPVYLLMSPNMVTSKPDDTLAQVRDKMARAGVRHVPVIDDDDSVAGIVSARDVLVLQDINMVAEHSTTAGRVMRKKLVTAEPEAPLSEVVRTMMAKDVGAVLIVKDGGLEGIFTDVDAVVALDRALDPAYSSENV